MRCDVAEPTGGTDGAEFNGDGGGELDGVLISSAQEAISSPDTYFI